ncbi:hypothetical protein INR49_027875 [Caranx melampygus]|nr:hypothetical protein INR49_027875 [Caranx melampygus]
MLALQRANRSGAWQVISKRSSSSACSARDNPGLLHSKIRTETIEMDTSKLPRIQDEERESQFGYVHGFLDQW